ncbi:MAG: 50S ribosomal protein L28 [Oscillospiraceae bacterium]|jgi:large subunit ribosomal protein L28|nr:50S ribosomal protein L28 [Oscillospiraceae bacterium]
MAKCDICGKSLSFGIKVSHSHRRSNRKWHPNVHRAKLIIDGIKKRVSACARCMRSEKLSSNS